MLLVIALGLVVFTSLFLSALFDFKGFVGRILSWYILGMANVILTAEIAGLFDQVSNAFFFIGVHAMLAFVSFVIWYTRNKPKLFPDNLRTLIKELLLVFKENLPIGVLALFVLGIYLLDATLIVFVHANTNDSLAVHLARTGYWTQFGSFRPWLTENTYQIAYPFNAQVQFLWTTLLSGTDQLVEFVQYFSAVFAAVGIVGIGKYLGYNRPQRLFSGLIWATLPMILLQSTTTQNDLIAGSLVMIGLYFLYAGISDRNIPHLILGALAAGISLGVKQTAFFAIPGVAVLLVLFIIRFKTKIWKSVLIFLSACVISFLLFGSYMYISNQINFQNPFGPKEFAVPKMTVSGSSVKRSFLLNLPRYLFQAVDPTGIPSYLKDDFAKVRGDIASKVFSIIHLDLESDPDVVKNPFSYYAVPNIHEDEAWFGLLGFLLLLISVAELVRAVRKKNVFALGLLITAASAFVGILFFRKSWTPYHARYMITTFTCLAPFFGSFYKLEPNHKHLMNAILVTGVVAFSMVSTVDVVWNNSGKPLNSPRALLSGNRMTHYRFSGGFLTSVVEMVNNHVPQDATLGLAIGRSWEYPYFGENFSRTLVPVYPRENITDSNWLERNQVEFILVDTSVFESLLPPSNYVEVDSLKDFVLFQKGE